jgi:hypothetical protein
MFDGTCGGGDFGSISLFGQTSNIRAVARLEAIGVVNVARRRLHMTLARTQRRTLGLSQARMRMPDVWGAR